MSKISTVKFSDNPAVKTASNPDHYVEITVSVPHIIESWRSSLFSYEWLDSEGKIKSIENLPQAERHKRLNTETLIDAGQPLAKPVLGIGLLDNVEIGSGRAEFLTLAAHGMKTIPVHIPRSNLSEFKDFMAAGSERGNVLFYILIAVALLAALTYAVSQSGRGSVQQLSEDKIKLYSSEVLEYANAVTNAVSQLRLRGCKETQISFENDVVAGFENASAPVDYSCHVFNAAGGALRWKVMPAEFKGKHVTLDPVAGSVVFVGNISFPEAKSDKPELTMMVSVVKRELCLKMNETLGVDNPGGEPPDLTGDSTTTLFQGTYDDGAPEVITDPGGSFNLRQAACLRYELDDEYAYFFYKVLLSR